MNKPTPTIDVIIPTILPRIPEPLGRAMQSAYGQTLPPRRVRLAIDDHHQGAARTRNRILNDVFDNPDNATPPPEFIAFLDDDDWWYPWHLQTLYQLHINTGADFLHSWFTGNEPLQRHPEFAHFRGRQFDPEDPHHTTMAVMVHRRIAEQIRFRTDHPEGWELPQEDWRYILDCRDAGATFAGTGDVTWHYDNHGKNTSGLPHRW